MGVIINHDRDSTTALGGELNSVAREDYHRAIFVAQSIVRSCLLFPRHRVFLKDDVFVLDDAFAIVKDCLALNIHAGMGQIPLGPPDLSVSLVEKMVFLSSAAFRAEVSSAL